MALTKDQLKDNFTFGREENLLAVDFCYEVGAKLLTANIDFYAWRIYACAEAKIIYPGKETLFFYKGQEVLRLDNGRITRKTGVEEFNLNLSLEEVDKVNTMIILIDELDKG